MQREQLSVPKMILYALLVLAVYIAQTTLFGAWDFRGYHVDILPAFVAAAALCGGPMEGAVVGLIVGLFYDLGFIGIDGLYPLFFLAFGLVAGMMSRLTLSRSYVSMVMLNAFEMVLLGLLRYFTYLLPQKGASFLLVMKQVAGGTLLACLFCFIAYVPVSKLCRRFDPR
jgi:uncharacterized membrane protein